MIAGKKKFLANPKIRRPLPRINASSPPLSGRIVTKPLIDHHQRSQPQNPSSQHLSPMARGMEGVKADLSELRWYIAQLFLPFFGVLVDDVEDSPSPSPAHGEGPNPSPGPNSRAAPALGDLGEIAGGTARASRALRRRSEGAGIGAGIREEILQFVRGLVASPESWLEIPVPANPEFYMSDVQREHVAQVELLLPGLPALRQRICPGLMPESSFWKIYFARIHPELDASESEILSTHELVEEMQDPFHPKPQTAVAESYSSIMNEKSGDSEPKDDQPLVRPTSTEATEATTPQCIDGWFDTPVLLRETNASAETGPQVTSREDDSYSEAEEGYNVVPLRKSGFSPSIEAVDQDYSLISCNERLRLSQSDHDEASRQVPDRMFTCDESDWHEEDMGYEFVQRYAFQ